MTDNADEELLARIAQERSAQVMASLVDDFTARVEGIRHDKAELGRTKALMRKWVPLCEKGKDGDPEDIYNYCQGAYEASLSAALQANGVDPHYNGFFRYQKNRKREDWTYAADHYGNPQVSCNAAICFFNTNKDPALKECGISLKDYPNKTLEQMLIEGYNGGQEPCSVPIGSLVIVQSQHADGTLSLHTVMFTGIDEATGKPKCTCANKERVDEVMPDSWLRQTASSSRGRENDCFIVNMQKAVEIQIQNEEREKMNAMGREAYLADLERRGINIATQPAISKDLEELQAVEKETLEQKDPPKKEEKKEELPKKESPKLQPEKKGEAKEGEEGVFSEGKVSVTGNGTTNTATAPEPKKSFWKRLGERLRNFDNRVRGWLGLPQKEHKPEVQPQPAQTTEPKKSFWKRMGDGLRNFDNWVRDRLGMERKGPKPEVQPQPAQTTEPKGAKKVLQDIGKSLSYAGRKIGDNFRWLRRRILERVDRKANLKRTPFENFNASLHSQLKGFQRHSTMRTLMRSAAESERTSTVERSSFLHRGKER